MHIDDAAIIDGLQRGNQEAFNGMFRKYYKMLTIHAYHVVGDIDEAQDVVQDVFSKLLHLSHIWPRIVDLRGYLFRCVHNKSLNTLNTRKASKIRMDAYTSETLHFLNQEQSIAYYDADPEAEALKRIENLLPELPPQRCIAIKLVYEKGASYVEAACAMGISTNSVKTHLRLGKEFLKEKLTSILLIFLVIQIF